MPGLARGRTCLPPCWPHAACVPRLSLPPCPGLPVRLGGLLAHAFAASGAPRLPALAACTVPHPKTLAVTSAGTSRPPLSPADPGLTALTPLPAAAALPVHPVYLWICLEIVAPLAGQQPRPSAARPGKRSHAGVGGDSDGRGREGGNPFPSPGASPLPSQTPPPHIRISAPPQHPPTSHFSAHFCPNSSLRPTQWPCFGGSSAFWT